MTYAAVAGAHRRCRLRDVAFVLGMSALGMCFSTPLLAAEPVLVPFPNDFAESITATSDGALIFSSFAGGRISRAAPGAVEASEWIKPGTNGLLSVLGVLADETTNTLYACSFDASGNIRNIRVLETGPAGMTAKVVTALRAWKFQPAMRGNQPVEVTAILGFGIDTNDRF